MQLQISRDRLIKIICESKEIDKLSLTRYLLSLVDDGIMSIEKLGDDYIKQKLDRRKEL